MNKTQFIRRLAGTVTLTGLTLGWLVSDWLYLITAFAGLNLLQSSFTGICPPEKIYDKMYDQSET
jgi:Protein of unknown function (DUF2892).